MNHSFMKSKKIFNSEKMINSENFKPFRYGFIQNPCKIKLYSIEAIANEVNIKYPSRINAMAMDPSAITEHSGRIFMPGEIVFPVALFLNVRIFYIPDNLGRTIYTGERPALVKHAVALAQAVFGCNGSFEIHASGMEIPHLGLGSSGRLIAAVFNGINRLFSSPLPPHVILQYLAQNHGEEIEGESDYLMPVQCIGGAAAAGLYHADMLLIAGENTVIFQRQLEEGYYWVIGWPPNYVSPDAKTAMEKEIQKLELFAEIGCKNKEKIAWRILHELIPAAVQGNFRKVGEIIEWYRYDLGSIDACSFSWPSLREIADQVLKLRHNGDADIVTVSSVGPACCVLTKKPEKCLNFMQTIGLKTLSTRPASIGNRQLI